MTTADLVDDAESGQQVNSNGNNHHRHGDKALLSNDENGDKKPVIVNSRNSHHEQNGGTIALSIDATSKAREAMSNGDAHYHEPPDGGVRLVDKINFVLSILLCTKSENLLLNCFESRAWSIMLGSFVINGVLFSIINCYSLFYTELQKKLEENGESEVSTKAGKLIL